MPSFPNDFYTVVYVFTSEGKQGFATAGRCLGVTLHPQPQIGSTAGALTFVLVLAFDRLVAILECGLGAVERGRNAIVRWW